MGKHFYIRLELLLIMSNRRIIITESDKKVRSVEIDGILFPFKKPIEVNIFIEKYYDSFSNISELVDFASFKDKSEKTEWDKDELRRLLDNSNMIQKCVLEVLIDKQVISKKDLITEIASLFVKDYNRYGSLKNYTHGNQLTYRVLKGHIGGFKRRVNSLNKEEIFKIKKDTYEINKKYIELLKILLNE